MEIQDRNSIMQLALNFNFDSKNLSSASEIGFIDMIKNVPVDNNVKASAFDTSKNADSLVSEKNKTSRPSNKNNNDFSANKTLKKTATKSSDKVEKKTVEQNNKQEVTTAPAAVNSSNPQDNVQTQPSTDAAYVQVENDVESTGAEVATEIPAIIENAETMVAENLWDLGKIFDLPQMSVSPIEQTEVVTDDTDIITVTPENTTSEDATVTTIVEDTTSAKTVQVVEKVTPQTVAMNLDTIEDTTAHKAASSQQNDNPLNMPIDEKSDLLIQQAQHLDTKIGTSHHLKIDVNVNEAKIAAPIENNILQNSFAITSMLQGDNMSDTPINVENFIEGEQILTNNNTVQNNAETTPLAVNNVFVADISGQTASLSASEDVAMINSIQPVELSVSHLTPKNELSPRLQEVNDDASLKGLGKEVIEQIKVNITKSAVKGVDTIDIELKPEELGKVQVRMYISRDGKLHADIIASRQETSDLLQREVESLSKSFQDAGYDTDKQNFNFSSQEERQANHNREENKFQQFIGETLAQESEPTGVNDNLAYDPKVGLNIRV